MKVRFIKTQDNPTKQSSYLNKTTRSIPFGRKLMSTLRCITLKDPFSVLDETIIEGGYRENIRAPGETLGSDEKGRDYHTEYVLTIVGNGCAEYFRGCVCISSRQ